VDNGDVAKQADQHVMRLQIGDRHRLRGLRQKAGPVEQRAVGVGTVKLLGQQLVEAAHIAMLHRGDVVVIERVQRVEIGLGSRTGGHGQVLSCGMVRAGGRFCCLYGM
jgi:hypothetical protein